MTGGAFLYFWRQYEASVSGSTKKRVRCVGCSHVFEYEITRQASGRGDSPFYLSNAEAKANARKRAHANLTRALSEAVEPVHCPFCGMFQPDMVRVLREQHGKCYDPNKYASERIAVPMMQALLAAGAENTVEAYTKFMEVWPTDGWPHLYAEEKIKELRYPPYLRWFISHLWWIVWGAVVLLIIGIVTVGQTLYYRN
jgi:hypothetical protein